MVILKDQINAMAKEKKLLVISLKALCLLDSSQQSVPDPDLAIRRGAWSPKEIFSILRASVCSKNKGPRVLPLDLLLTVETFRFEDEI